MQKTIAKLFDVHQNTISNWKKEDKKGLNFFLKYFKKEDLEEFIQTGQIKKMEELNYLITLKREIVTSYANIFYQLFVDLTKISINRSGEFREFILNLINQCTCHNVIDDVLKFDILCEIASEKIGVNLLLDQVHTQDNPNYIGEFYPSLFKHLSSLTTKNMEEIKLFKSDIINEFENLIHPFYLEQVDNFYSKFFDTNGTFIYGYDGQKHDEFLGERDNAMEQFLNSWQDHSQQFNDKTILQTKYEEVVNKINQ